MEGGRGKGEDGGGRRRRSSKEKCWDEMGGGVGMGADGCTQLLSGGGSRKQTKMLREAGCTLSSGR